MRSRRLAAGAGSLEAGARARCPVAVLGAAKWQPGDEMVCVLILLCEQFAIHLPRRARVETHFGAQIAQTGGVAGVVWKVLGVIVLVVSQCVRIRTAGIVVEVEHAGGAMGRALGDVLGIVVVVKGAGVDGGGVGVLGEAVVHGPPSVVGEKGATDINKHSKHSSQTIMNDPLPLASSSNGRVSGKSWKPLKTATVRSHLPDGVKTKSWEDRMKKTQKALAIKKLETELKEEKQAEFQRCASSQLLSVVANTPTGAGRSL